MRTLISSVALLVAVLSPTTGAVADVAPPETYACLGRQDGVACSYQPEYYPGATRVEGACKLFKCTSRSRWDGGDASSSSSGETYDCLSCVRDYFPDGGRVFLLDGGRDDSGSFPRDAPGADKPGPGSGDGGTGCAVNGGAGNAIGPWLLAGIFAALVSVIRRCGRSRD